MNETHSFHIDIQFQNFRYSRNHSLTFFIILSSLRLPSLVCPRFPISYQEGDFMAIFGISDLHLSLNSNKPMDVFPGWNDYVERVASHWKRTVREEDTVVLPGDLSWALKLEEAERDIAFLHALPGRKIILKGNHDLWWGTMNKLQLFLSKHDFSSVAPLYHTAIEVGDYAICGTRGWDYDAADDEKVLMREVGRLRVALEQAVSTGKTPLVFLHFPPAYGNYVCRPMMDVLHEFDIRQVYHGHLHGAGSQFALFECEGIELKLLSCDRLQFQPVKIAD